MKQPTSPEIREVIVRFQDEGRTYEEIAELTDVGYATVSRVLRLHRETGGVKPKAPVGGNQSPIRGKVEKRLRDLVEAMPDSTVREFAEALERAEKLATSRPSVQRALKRMATREKELHRGRARQPREHSPPRHLRAFGERDRSTPTRLHRRVVLQDGNVTRVRLVAAWRSSFRNATRKELEDRLPARSHQMRRQASPEDSSRKR